MRSLAPTRPPTARTAWCPSRCRPTLAYDTAGTIAEAQRLWAAVNRPNAMIKIPGTEPGLRAVEASIAAGINVNVTLLFSVERHAAVIEAYLAGLETRVAGGKPIGSVVSVASFFVSRVDTRIDPMLEASGHGELRGKAAIANARAAYQVFQSAFAGERWDLLYSHGARVQRPLWASTSTKDPALPDTYYVEALVAPDTVNTLPPGHLHRLSRPRPAGGAHRGPRIRRPTLAALAEAGISMDEVTEFLEEDGVAKFAASYQSLLAGIEAKADALVN